jgi:phosphoglycolate phosphatase-like HAD superfamily hydrolase
MDIHYCLVIGDSIWDMLAAQRARSLGVGLLSGGYGQEELEDAGAFRVYEDPRRGGRQALMATDYGFLPARFTRS